MLLSHDDGGVHLLTLNDLRPCFVTRFAKERRLRIWRDYVAPTANLDQKDKQFVAKVSYPQHPEMHSGCCRASDNIKNLDNQELKHFYLRASQ